MTVALTREQQEGLVGEMLLLGLLGRIIFQYPGDEHREWFQSLIDSEAFSESPYAPDQAHMVKGLELLQNWSKQDLSDDVYKDMQADYMRLFIGVGNVVAPPWESVFFDESRQTFRQQTLQVRNWYRRFGLEPEKVHREPDDHIGLELTFLANLAGQALQAAENGDEQAFDSLMGARRQFLAEHPLKWVFSWCDLVNEHARTDFYLGLGHLIRGALLAIAQHYDLQGINEAAQ